MTILTILFSDPESELEAEIDALVELQLICVNGDEVHPSQFGRAILSSSLDISSAMQIKKDLENGMKSVCLDSEIHLLFLVFHSSVYSICTPF